MFMTRSLEESFEPGALLPCPFPVQTLRETLPLLLGSSKTVCPVLLAHHLDLLEELGGPFAVGSHAAAGHEAPTLEWLLLHICDIHKRFSVTSERASMELRTLTMVHRHYS